MGRTGLMASKPPAYIAMLKPIAKLTTLRQKYSTNKRKHRETLK